ncbi:MAG: PIN domain-containing protein [Candidatus Thermoplasmatota archaeon]|jgi:predicted nucleic acid-binding protein|nr:PIN domain-containing protein [Candidatus Thermoplasmatota archaeon]MCL5785964.1 PIN domain-containing protein [Candidatus Thermoplasmatota archaeon]
MKLVVDANILISALIRDGASREIIFANEFNLVCPEYLSEELEKYKILIANKSGLTAEEVSLMIALLFKRIRIIPSADYQTKMLEAESLMENDISDAPYVACYIATKSEGIWTNDSDFVGKRRVTVYRTEDLLKLMRSRG